MDTDMAGLDGVRTGQGGAAEVTLTLVAPKPVDARVREALIVSVTPLLALARALPPLDPRVVRLAGFSPLAGDRAALRAAVEAEIGDHALDIFVSRADAPVPRLLIADMDSTMITVECIDELADFIGRKAEVAVVTERAMRGELDFADALRARVALLQGFDEAMLARVLEQRVRATPGAATLVHTLKALGADSLIVSGGFTHFADPVARALGFDRAIANRLSIANGTLTGRVDDPIVDARAKAAALEAWCVAHAAESDRVCAIGDGANDIPMLAAAGLGIAYCAKPAARAAASGTIDYGDLTSALFAFGLAPDRWCNARAAPPLGIAKMR